jgi:hypothetical protein
MISLQWFFKIVGMGIVTGKGLSDLIREMQE